MELVKRIEELAVRIGRFFGTETDLTAALWDAKRRKGIAADLKGYAEWHEDDAVAYEASMLYREVVSL